MGEERPGSTFKHTHKARTLTKRDQRLPPCLETLRSSALEVVQEDVQTLRLLTVVLDDDTRAPDDLAGVTLTVDLGESGPLAEDLGVRDLDQVDVVLGAKSLDELQVLGCEVGEAESA